MHHPASPASIAQSFARHWGLIKELVKRDFSSRYRGSAFGIAWILLVPLIFLVVYTVFFSGILKARWLNEASGSTVLFAVNLFAGLLLHMFLAECINRAPHLILSQPNYVKKVVFPLEIIPLVSVASSFVNLLISVLVLIAFCLFSGFGLHLTVFLVPVVFLPLVLFSLGVSAFLSSLGVYMRDVSQVTGFISTILLFLSPVFFSSEMFPADYRWLLNLNPLTLPIEQLRSVVIEGKGFGLVDWLCGFVVGLVSTCAGFAWFQKTRSGFADVI
ncbi:ABC transporter permease [Agrobacterium sp. fls2-241-TYG-188a]|uniref:ABC transporter permease n=1 Tax=Agrobacterium sp. fls2-241-TYG-188a TaxID=3040275 RepID=UPI0025506BC1|nr:ABC transporter permease [Agrobacterium sp. fls2-241-TYG-188a]